MTVTRFAPSPTGYLHLGHAHSALVGWHKARAETGRFLLRIEDIDPARCRPEFEAAILEDLSWLGLDWDGPVRRQSDHLADYQAALDRLRDMGLIYPGTCRNQPADLVRMRQEQGDPYALRLDVAKARAMTGRLTFVDEREGTVAARPETLGDVVLARRDAPASYHLCVTVDDHLQGVTLVTRGVDLFHATHIHRPLQAILDLNVPTYLHHLLLTNAAGERLSKRDGAVAIRTLRQAGRSAAEVRALAGFSY